MSNGAIGKWRNSNPTVDKLKKVADYFGVSIEYFLATGSEEKTG
ncbi:MAG: helix-turn-helix transcriptional regulator [Schaedlerella sp.]|nr:helix-turn-helix transcriptional regulator [Schaedlerella sp.]